MKILLDQKILKNLKIDFSYVSEHCVSFATKNPIWPLAEGEEEGGGVGRSFSRNELAEILRVRKR